MSRLARGVSAVRVPERVQLVSGGAWPGRPPRPVPAPSGHRALSGCAELPLLQVFRQLESSPRGLAEDDAQERLAACGDNTLARGQPPGWAAQLSGAARDPFVLVLLGLDAVSAAIGNGYSAAVITVLVALSCLLRFCQERRAGRAAAALRDLVSATATVRRRASAAASPVVREVPVDQIVPGDVVQLAPGDMVPADMRLLRSAGLAISQALLTGESTPAAKQASGRWPPGRVLLECPWLCFAGSSVISGSGTGVVVATGPRTYFAAAQPGTRLWLPETCFEFGMKRVSWTLIRFMGISLGLMFAVTSAAGGHRAGTVLFLASVAVGLTPEMMPVVVSSALTRGAHSMARLGVIVKRLPAIHNLGAMDVLCTDKTGTLTCENPVLDFSVDPDGRPGRDALRLAVLNSYWCVEGPGGPACSLLDEALLKHAAGAGLFTGEDATAVAVSPFDPAARRASVVLRRGGRPGADLVVTKGAPTDVLDCCSQVQAGTGTRPLRPAERARLIKLADRYAACGARVLAVASAERPGRSGRYQAGAETGLTLAGFVGFRDPPKPSAPEALRRLASSGIGLKVITGDHPLLAARMCRQAGISPGIVVDGPGMDALAEDALPGMVETATVFARVRPDQKARIIRALRTAGHTVGYLGDGINDAAALREADVGICVESATDAARESAEVILARKDLTALTDAVVQSRLAFGNIIKYLKITISANVGNVVSMLLATMLLPFLPMLPLQVLIQNLCFDLSQLTIVFDRVEEPSLTRPRTFDQRDLARFAICFGLVNTLADLATFMILRHLGGSDHGPASRAIFRAGWFTENLLSQAVTVLILRSRTGPFPRRRPPWPVLAGLAALAATGLLLPLSPLAAALALHAPPPGFFPLLAAVLGGYGALLLATRAAYRKTSAPWL